MHQALQIPEILHLTFSYLPKNPLVQCALVCRSWSEVALDVIWYEVTDLRELANLLSPVKKRVGSGHVSYEFDPLPGTLDWLRFESRYRHRIRFFLYDIENVNYDLTPLLREIQRARLSSPFLPNLHTLEWDGSRGFDDVMMFMHEGVKRCAFTTYDSEFDVSGLIRLSEAVKFRMPSLTFLDMSLHPSQDYSDHLALLLEALPQLIEIMLPAFRDISQILSCLSRSSSLKTLHFEHVALDESIAVSHAGGHLGHEIFPSLECWTLALVEYQRFCPFLKANKLDGLTSLVLHTIILESPASVRNVLADIARCCPSLVELRLEVYPREKEFIENDIQIPPYLEQNLVPFDAIQPILACTKMTHFHIDHPYPLLLTDAGIEEIAMAWNQLEYLHLCNSPFKSVKYPHDAQKPTIQGIFSLMEHCDKLEILDILIDTHTGRPSVNPPSNNRTLLELNIGASNVDREDVYNVAEALAHVCRGALQWSANSEDDEDDEDDVDETRKENWQMVKDLISRFS